MTDAIADYRGTLLTHLNAVYREDDRALALELVAALGFEAAAVPGSRSGIVAVHPEPEDRNTTRNVIYLTRLHAEHAEADALLRARMAADPELNAFVERYRESARAHPDSSAHVGVLYPSEAALERALAALHGTLSAALAARVWVSEPPRYPPIAGFADIRQAFLFTDVFAVGPPALGQLIELQVERGT